jgi:PII-like signaling protein
VAVVSGAAVRVLTRERARVGHHSVVDALVELVRREGLAGITVTRALEGYSAHGGLRTSGWADLADDLPLVIEIVDRAERIEQVLPAITALITEGALTVTALQLFVPDAGQEAGG